MPGSKEGKVGRRPDRRLEAGDLRRAVEIFAPIFSEPGTGELRKQFIDQCLNLPEATITRFFTFDPKNDVADCWAVSACPRCWPMAATTGMFRSPPRGRWRSAFRCDALLLRGQGHLPTFTATAEFCDVLRRSCGEKRSKAWAFLLLPERRAEGVADGLQEVFQHRALTGHDHGFGRHAGLELAAAQLASSPAST